jgi:outer membrane immunogenic protein
MNAVLTYAADTPLMRRTSATNGIWASAIAALSAVTLMVAAPGAFAADIPLKAPGAVAAPVVAPIPIYNWTGFYIGGNFGGAFDRTTIDDTFFGTSFSNTRSGFIGGGQVGYNWQISPMWVLGIEWMFDGADIRSDNTAVFANVDNVITNVVTANEKVDWIQTLAARFGWAANNWLFYGKAGAGWVHDKVTVTNFVSGDGVFAVDGSDTRTGWMVGVGIEYGITHNWTVKVEWDHIGLGDVTHTGFIDRAGDIDFIRVSRRFDLLTAGLNYKF